MANIPKVAVGDVVQLRKKHPCGSDMWRIKRLGSDVVLHNDECDRTVTLPRGRFNKSVKKVFPASDADDST
ncbi:MAG: DUF951 domain-containing protein [Chloroflexota bacterium]